MMRGKTRALSLVALALMAAATQATEYPFPYVNCINSPAAYTLAPAVRRPDNNTFCFTVKVDAPVGCDSYCCTKADLRKVLIDVNPECKVVNPRFTATINGEPTKVKPAIEPGISGPDESYVLRLTQLGLNLTTADGAEICVTLGANAYGAGCTTMETLCKSPPGAPAGTCTAAMFDSKFDCCPATPIPEYRAPPAASPPPALPLAPSVRPCTACATLNLEQVVPTFYNVSFTPAQCALWRQMVITDVTAQAALVGAQLLPTSTGVMCTPTMLEVCFKFANDEDGAKLQDWIQDQLYFWYEQTADPCKAYYRGPYRVTGLVSNGADDTGCLNARSAISCDPPFDDFPQCKCDTTPGATPFYAKPFLEEAPGRTNTTTLYCFELVVQDAWDPTSACGQTTTLLKAEVYADDTKRRKVKGLAVQPAKATAPRYLPTSWGPTGDNTLKFTPLNWSLQEANGAKLCMEVDNSYGVGPLCFSGPTETCKIIFFDKTKDCCPLFEAST